jgi:uncharacterized membrane protein
VPNLAVTIGTALVLTSMVALLLFVHHLARSIIADSIINRVGRDLDDNAARLLPKKDNATAPPPKLDGSGADIFLDCEGYVQAIDAAPLARTARAENAIVVLDIRAGHHIVAGNLLGNVHPSGALTPALREALMRAILVGSEPTPVQDLEFSIRQLVELAVRALSPGVNDPYTAIATIDRLTLSLARIMRRGPAQTRWCDDAGHVRVVLPATTFGGLIDASFNMIRQNGERSAAVLIRLADSLNDLTPLANPAQRQDIERHRKMILNAGRRNLHEAEDLKALEQRIETRERGLRSAAG